MGQPIDIPIAAETPIAPQQPIGPDLTHHDIKVIGMHILFAAMAAGITALLKENLGIYQPYIMPLLMVFAEIIRRFID